jgi:mono/diheme cytochrome c family protein
MTKRLAAVIAVVWMAGLCLAVAQKKEAPKKATGASAREVAAGKDLFKEQCLQCHWPDKDDKRIGPGMKGLYKRDKMWDGKPFSEAAVKEMIIKGGGKMVGFEEVLNPKQIDQVIAYLKTL